MADGHEGLSRRDLVGLGCASLFASLVPAGASGASPAAMAAPVARRLAGTARTSRSGIVWRLRQVREEYAAAVETYRATGDADPIERARLQARHKFGFALGLEARDDEERGLFREAGVLLEQIESDFEELPLSLEMKARFAKLRTWAEAGGQQALRYRPAPPAVTCAGPGTEGPVREHVGTCG